jgi:ABC-type proline/glycine betaine transport system ATPase subunit
VREAEILKGIDLSVGEGEIACITGPSGSGKSTLLRALNRLVEPTTGEIYLDGAPTSTMDPLALRRRVGMIFQLPALSGETVEEAVLYGPRLLGRGANVTGLLGEVGLDPALASRDPQSLSVGQQQRVSIARALALGPEVLLMDEPTSALDESARDRIEGLVKELNRSEGLTFVIVSHDLGQVGRLADQVVLVDAGRTTGEWDREEFDGGGSEKVRRIVSGRP